MKIALIVAHAENLVIGRDGDLPWHYSEDLKRFKRLTSGHVLVMGRRTYESIGAKPLPNRTNVVISRTKEYGNCQTFGSIDDALKHFRNEELLFIGGGASLYETMIDRADYLYITLIHRQVEGDTFFPEYRNQIGTRWKLSEEVDMGAFSFLDYVRM